MLPWWSPLNLALLALGPASIFLLLFLLPRPENEGPRSPEEQPTGVVAQVVGYSIPHRPGARSPLVVGTGPTADVKLIARSAPQAAALLFPPDVSSGSWRIAPADPEAPPFLLGPTAEDTTRIVYTSAAPWRKTRFLGLLSSGFAGDEVVVTDGGSRVRVARARVPVVEMRSARGAEPDMAWVDPEAAHLMEGRMSGIVAVSCPAGERPRIWWTTTAPGRPLPDPLTVCPAPAGWTEAEECGSPRGACVDWDRRWSASVHEPRSGRNYLSARGEPVTLASLWLSMDGSRDDSIRIGVRPPACGPGRICPPAHWTILDPASDRELQTIGAPELRTGDVVVIGGHPYQARVRSPAEGGAAIDLFHVRRPSAPSVFRSSSGPEAYHPLGVWNVPECENGQAGMGVLIRHAAHGRAFLADDDLLVGELQAAAAARHVRAVDGAAADSAFTETVGLCYAATTGEIRLRLDAAGARNVTLEDGSRRSGVAARAEASLGSEDQPREVLVVAGGLLLRVAPASAARVQRSVRLGVAGYLSLLLVLQGVPLTYARSRRRRVLGESHPWNAELVSPSRLGAATILQLVTLGIAWLFLLGAAYQALLSAHAQLAGTPDYVQAFLQAVVLTGAVLSAAGWFCVGGPSIARRLGFAGLGAALSLLLAYAWWRMDGAAVPPGLWLSALRNGSAGAAGSPDDAAVWLVLAGFVAVVGACLIVYSLVRRRASARDRLAQVAVGAVRHPLVTGALLLSVGLFVGLVAVRVFARPSALAIEISLLFALAWYGATRWDYGRSTAQPRAEERERERRDVTRVAIASFTSILLFLFVGARLPTPVSVGVFLAGFVPLVAAFRNARARQQTLMRLVGLWAFVSVVGSLFVLWVLNDLGSVAAWIPAAIAGFYLWAVRPEESGEHAFGAEAARARLWLSVATACFLLGMLDLLNYVLKHLPGDRFDRPRQRFALVEDVAYPIGGEWVTQVRWLASEPGVGFRWVPNLNSDLAVFGIASNFGMVWALFASAVLLLIAVAVVFAADQGLREGKLVQTDLITGSPRSVPVGVTADEWRSVFPVLLRALGLSLGMLASLLLVQWLVHVATGASTHLPLTGLVFPWVSHGTTTHLLYAAAFTLPLAALAALGESSPELVDRKR